MNDNDSVAGRGTMTRAGYRPENYPGKVILIDPESGQGRNPMNISLEDLSRAGHPKRSLSQLRRAMAVTVQGKPDPDAYPEHVRAYKDVKAHCLGCAETASEVRGCPIIDCPFWPYRTGRNPHSAKRGVTTTPSLCFVKA